MKECLFCGQPFRPPMPQDPEFCSGCSTFINDGEVILAESMTDLQAAFFLRWPDEIKNFAAAEDVTFEQWFRQEWTIYGPSTPGGPVAAHFNG